MKKQKAPNEAQRAIMDDMVAAWLEPGERLAFEGSFRCDLLRLLRAATADSPERELTPT